MTLEEGDTETRMGFELRIARDLVAAQPVDAHLRNAGQAAVAYPGLPFGIVGAGEPAVRALSRSERTRRLERGAHVGLVAEQRSALQETADRIGNRMRER